MPNRLARLIGVTIKLNSPIEQPLIPEYKGKISSLFNSLKPNTDKGTYN